MTRVEDLKQWSTYFSQPFLVHRFKGANGKSMKDADLRMVEDCMSHFDSAAEFDMPMVSANSWQYRKVVAVRNDTPVLCLWLKTHCMGRPLRSFFFYYYYYFYCKYILRLW